jgi:hypothetical protein
VRRWHGKSVGWLAAALACAAAGQLLPEFYITMLNYVGLYALVALGLVVLTGVSGITSFGQAAFVGIGAYTTAVLATHYGASPWLGLLAGVAINLAAAVLLGGVTLRLSGHYLPLGTICWSVSLYYVFGNVAAFGGQIGMIGIPAITIFGYPLDAGRRMYYLIWAITLVALVLTDNVLHSRPGRAMRALKRFGHYWPHNDGIYLRKLAMSYLNASPRVGTCFIVRDAYFGGNPAVKSQVREEYIHNILDSDYVLCVRGGGNFSFRFFDQHRHSSIYGLSQFRVPPAPENRASASVWVQQRNVLNGEPKSSFGVSEM